MKYCKKCIQPDTRPGIVFDNEQVCSACRMAERKIDWTARETELWQIARWAQSQKACYDCAIGVSGGKDSHFQALYAKDLLGLRALLVNCAPDNISEVGRRNLENLVQRGFDMISLRPNPRIERALSKRAFYQYGNFVKPLEYPLYASAYIVAIRFGIPLIIQGENEGATLGTIEFVDPDGDALDFKNVQTVSGGHANTWVGEGIGLGDLFLYQFPSDEELEKAGLRAIYLSHYAREWSNMNNTEFARSMGLRGRPNHDPYLTGRTNPYFSIDVDLKLVNQYIKYLKFGFGATTDEVCYDVREGRMSRDEAIEVAMHYDGKIGDNYVQEWCDYIGIGLGEFWMVVDQYVNKKLFRKDYSTGRWKPRFRVGVDFEEEEG